MNKDNSCSTNNRENMRFEWSVIIKSLYILRKLKHKEFFSNSYSV